MPRKIFYWISLVILLLSAMVATGCFNEEKAARRQIKRFADIDICDNLEIAFHYRTNSGFSNGRESQYTVFSLENESIDRLKEKGFSEEKNKDIEKHFTPPIAFLDIEEIGIPDEYLPNFENDYLWFRTDNGVYFFYDVTNGILIVHIQGH